LTGVKAELSKLSSDKEDGMLVEIERISVEQRQQTASHCDELGQTLQVDIARLTKLTEQYHRDGVTQMKSASDQLLRQILGFVESTSVILAVNNISTFCAALGSKHLCTICNVGVFTGVSIVCYAALY